MKIAFFHELPIGGARRCVNDFGRYLKKKHRVDLYCIDNAINTNERDNFTNVYFYKFKNIIWKGKNWKRRFYKDTFELLKLYLLHKKISQYINKKNYDFAFVHGSKFTQAPFILRFIKNKKIYYCQETLRMVYENDFSVENIDIARKIYEKFIRALRKKIDAVNLRSADLILANSIFTEKNIFSAYHLESTVFYMGVDSKLFMPKIIDKDVDVLFVGSSNTINGYNLFMQAIKLLKIRHARIKYLSGSSGNKSWASDEEIVEIYNRSRVIVSLGRNEPFGLIPLEAMACGIPIVALNEGGYKETVLNNRTGFLVEPNQINIASAIDLLLSKPKLAEKFGRKGLSEINKRWSWEKRIGDFEKKMKTF